MAIGLGGVQWDFAIKYSGRSEVAAAIQNIQALEKVTLEAAKAADEFAKRESAAAQAAEAATKRALEAQRQLEIATKRSALTTANNTGDSAGSAAATQAWVQYIAASERAALAARQQVSAQAALAQSAQNTAAVTKIQEQAQNALKKAISEDIVVQQKKAQTNNQLAGSYNIALASLSAFLAAIGANKLYEFVKDATILAGRVENLGTILENVGSLAGYSQGTLASLEAQVKSLGITTQRAREALSLMVQGEIELSQAGKLARIAQDAAAISGINSSEAFNRLTTSIVRQNTWMLRNLGILVNLNNLYREYAVANNRVVTTLTLHEKQQLFLNEVLRKGALIQGTYEASMKDVYKQYTSLDRVTEEARRELGEQFLPVFRDVITAITRGAIWFSSLEDSTKSMTAGFAAAIIVTVSLTGTIVALAGAFAILWTAMGPVGWIVLGVTAAFAALAGAYVISSAQAENAKRAIEEAGSAAAAEASNIYYLRDAYEELALLELQRLKTGELTIDQQDRVNSIILESIPLLKEQGFELQKLLSSDPGIVAGKLLQLRGDIAKTAEQRIATAQNEAEAIENILSDIDKKIAKLRPKTGKAFAGNVLGFENFIPFDEAQRRIDKLKDERLEFEKLLEAKKQYIKATGDVRGEQRVQQLQELEKAQESAFQQALRFMQQMNTVRANPFDNDDVKFVTDYTKALEELSSKLLTHSQIEELVTKQLALRTKELERANTESLKNTPTGPDGDAARVKLANQLVGLKAQAAIEAGKEILRLKEEAATIKRAYTELNEYYEIKQKIRELKLREEEAGEKARSLGLDEELAKLQEKYAQQEIMNLKAIESIDEKILEQKERILKINQQLSSQQLPGGEKFTDEIAGNLISELSEREKALATIQKQRALAIRDMTENEVEEERKRAARIKEIREKLSKDVEKLKEQELDKEQALNDAEIREERRLVQAKFDAAKENLQLAQEKLEVQGKVLDKLEEELHKTVELRQEVRDFQNEMADNLRNGMGLREAFTRAIGQFPQLIAKQFPLGNLMARWRQDVARQQEFAKLINNGVDPDRAARLANKRFPGAPLGPGEQQRLIDEKRKDDEEQKEFLAEGKKKIEKREREAEKAVNEKAIAAAAKKREEIRRELEEIRLLLAKAEQDKKNQKGIPKDLKDERDPFLEAARENAERKKKIKNSTSDELENASIKSEYDALQRRQKAQYDEVNHLWKQGLSQEDEDRKRAELNKAIFDLEAELRKLRDRIGPPSPALKNVSFRSSSIQPVVVISNPGSGLGRILSSIQGSKITSATVARDKEILGAMGSQHEAQKTISDAALKTASAAAKTKELIEQENEDFEREFTSKGLV